MINLIEDKTHKLSIYLIKKGEYTFEDTLKTNDCTMYSLKDSIGYEGLIVVGQMRTSVPNWKGLIQQGTDEQINFIENTSNRAVVYFRIEKRIFAVAFGFGKFLLKEDLIEREFGLRTALNLTDYDKFISVDKASLSDVTVLTKIQSSTKAKPESFNLDVISDLLTGVTGGVVADGNYDFGSIITGSDGINILPKVNFKKIPEILFNIKKAYESGRYKDRFDWIDNLRELKDPAKVEVLKALLIDALKERNSTHLHIAPPQIINWDDFEGYAFTGHRDEIQTDFHIDYFYDYKDAELANLTWDKLSDQKIFIKYGSYDDRFSQKFWRYLNFETTLNEDVYVFSLGKWYQINNDYVAEIKKYVLSIEESDIEFVDYDSNEKLSEGDYNILFAQSSADLVLFDKELIRSEYMNRSDIELCDVYSLSKKEFVHVKFRYNSATLSHLFAQGKISSYALLKDRGFRKNCRTKFGSLALDRDSILLDGFRSNDYTVTFALIDKIDRSFVDALPFFSLINDNYIPCIPKRKSIQI